MILIFFLSSQTIDELQQRGLALRMWDKLQHLIAYSVLSLLIAQALAGGWLRPPTLRQAVTALVLASLYGAGDEIHQSYVPTRHMDLGDWIADTAGAAASLVWWGIMRSRN